MQKWINVVENNCVPDREEEFNDWYDSIHLPDILETPGFVSARRYVNKEFRDGRGKYLSIFEIETHDIDKTMAVRLKKRALEIEQGHGSNLWLPVWRDVLYKQITERFPSKK